MNSYFTVKELPESERPYEKFEHSGAASLSDAELLAIIIRTGTKRERATELAFRVLNHSKKHKGLIGLNYLTLQELMKIPGIGKVKATQILCIAELAKRMELSTRKEGTSFQKAEWIAGYYMPLMRHLIREEIMLLMLDTRYRKIADKVIATGTVNASLMDTREILLEAMRHEAVYLIVLHNHPSGCPVPSKEDIASTKRLAQACELVGIPLKDHIIIGDNTYVSMKEQAFF